ncbi:WLM domain-containing protein [Infundibulicybe gibba]|nr:WLM domain-containing protein [Infundibulicybe gibba]
MVHQRINERESNPNPHINFITALQDYGPSSKEDAHQYLCALAAQVKPIMKAHGFAVNTLVEYQYNEVFAGRNWNSGETIVELVLRRGDGSFLPSSWLMSTLCHELAHIKHMNHGQAFQALWKRLRDEVRILQFQGYFGDGFWSSGTRLADSSKITGKGIDVGGLPEFMCGGAQTRSRPTATRRLRTRKPRPLDTTIVASTNSGRQTAKKRKAGARVTSKYAFAGEGMSLGDDRSGGKGKGKQAASKRAREERAAAIEKRLALQETSSQPTEGNVDPASEGDSSDEEELIAETDSDRRKALLSSQHADDVKGLEAGTSWLAFEDDFNFIGGSSTTGTQPMPGTSNRAQGPMPQVNPPNVSSTSLGIGKLVQNEVNLRKKESLGMAPIKGGGRTLGGTRPAISARSPPQSRLVLPVEAAKVEKLQWGCLVCTLDNDLQHLACSACATPRGGQTWTKQA